MDLGISERVALVAAASSGLGKAVATALVREGVRVMICARDPQRLEAARAAIATDTGADIHAIPADVTRQTDIDNLVEQTVAKLGSVQILVNNAGGPPPGSFEQTGDDQWQQAFELSLMSSVRLTRALLPNMRRARWGRIINITSVTVKQPIEQLLLSNSLRLGVIGWAKTLATQLASEGITINNVCPGWTETGRVRQLLAARAETEGISIDEARAGITAQIPAGRLGRPEEFASLVAFLASAGAGYINGATIQCDGGMTKGYF